MLDTNDLHRFYEANIPDYERRDFLRISKFFVKQMQLPGKRPIKTISNNFQRFREFVAFDWFGWDEIGTKKLIEVAPTGTRPEGVKKKKKDYGRCVCGSFMVKRQNRSDRSYFLGCSRWPKCTNTKPLLD